MSTESSDSASFSWPPGLISCCCTEEVARKAWRLRPGLGRRSRWTSPLFHKGCQPEGGSGGVARRRSLAAANLEAIEITGHAHLREDFRRFLEDVLLVIASRDVGQVQVTDSGLGGQGR